MTYFLSQTKNKSEQSGLCSDVARPEGFEPPFFRIGICCVIQLRHGRIKGLKPYFIFIFKLIYLYQIFSKLSSSPL